MQLKGKERTTGNDGTEHDRKGGGRDPVIKEAKGRKEGSEGKKEGKTNRRNEVKEGSE
jgi:hypothetical protein